MLSMHWLQTSSGSAADNRRSSSDGVDFAQQRMQAFTLEGSEPIPTHSPHSASPLSAPPARRETRENRLQAAGRISRVPTHQGVPARPPTQDDNADADSTLGGASGASSPTLSSSASAPVPVPPSSRSHVKPPDTIATFSRADKVADLCRAHTAAFLMHNHDATAFIGSNGCNIKRLRFLSGAKRISLLNHRVYEVGGMQLVLVQVWGRPECVHKAVEITESSYEIFPPPPATMSPAISSQPRTPPSASRSAAAGPARPPGSTGRSPTFVGAPSRSGPARPPGRQHQVPARKPSPAANDPTYAAAVLSGSSQLAKQAPPPPPRSVSVTEVSADSESKSAADQWSVPTVVGLLEFCREQAACIKGPPEAFAQWLRSQDVESLHDLREAVEDDEFREEMHANGLKGFKKAAFKKAIQCAVESSSD